MDPTVIEWMTDQLDQEGYEVIWAPNVRRLTIANEVSNMTLAQAGEGLDVKDLIRRDMANQIAHKLAEMLVITERQTGQETLRMEATLRVLIP